MNDFIFGLIWLIGNENKIKYLTNTLSVYRASLRIVVFFYRNYLS